MIFSEHSKSCNLKFKGMNELTIHQFFYLIKRNWWLIQFYSKQTVFIFHILDKFENVYISETFNFFLNSLNRIFGTFFLTITFRLWFARIKNLLCIEQTISVTIYCLFSYMVVFGVSWSIKIWLNIASYSKQIIKKCYLIERCILREKKNVITMKNEKKTDLKLLLLRNNQRWYYISPLS